MRRFLTVIIAMGFVTLLLLTACGGGVQADVFPEEVEETPAPTPAPTPTPEPEPPSPPPGYAISSLTGLYICEEAAQRRPFAVVYNNETRAMPQAGLMQADIIYEVLAEGSITRVVAIFQDFDAEMIGPVRSTRHYFTYFAQDHGAIMVHHGGSPGGYAAIRNQGIPHVDGMRYDGTVFWRYAERRYRGSEHTSFTSTERLMDIAEQLNFDMDVPQSLGLFEFYEELTAPRPQNIAEVLQIPFTGSNISIFEYNPEDNLYYKYIFGGLQMDYLTEEQVAVTNVIIQITTMAVVDNEGRRNVQMVGAGRGYLATNGTYSEISWVRDGAETPTRWYDAEGNPLIVNRGRTWISVINNQPTFEGFNDNEDENDDE